MDSGNRVLHVRLIGFSEAERRMMNSIFKLSIAPSRHYGYKPWSADAGRAPDVYLLDGDSDIAVNNWKSAFGDTVEQTLIVGGESRGLGSVGIARPLGLRVIGALDKMAPRVLAKRPATVAFAVGAGADPDRTHDAGGEPPSLAMSATMSGSATISRSATMSGSTPVASQPPAAFVPPAPAMPLAAPITGAPVMASPAAMPAAATQPEPQSDVKATESEFRVLAVDDSPLMRTFLKNKLEPYGVVPDFANSGEEAVFAISKKAYDIVFLDVMLPGMDGYDVCKLIKKNKANARTRVVMLTSRDKTFDKIRGTMAGCDGYLTKPVDETKLRAVIERHAVHRAL